MTIKEVTVYVKTTRGVEHSYKTAGVLRKKKVKHGNESGVVESVFSSFKQRIKIFFCSITAKNPVKCWNLFCRLFMCNYIICNYNHYY